MLGINILYQNEGSGISFSDMHHLNDMPNYIIEPIFQIDGFSLSFSGYKGYPKSYFVDEHAVIILEGLIYNKSNEQINILLQAISESCNNKEYNGFRSMARIRQSRLYG